MPNDITPEMQAFANLFLEHEADTNLPKATARTLYKSVIDMLDSPTKSAIASNFGQAIGDETHGRKVTKPGTMTGLRDLLNREELLGVVWNAGLMMERRHTNASLTPFEMSDAIERNLTAVIDAIKNQGEALAIGNFSIHHHPSIRAALEDIAAVTTTIANQPTYQQPTTPNQQPTTPHFEPWTFGITTSTPKSEAIRCVAAVMVAVSELGVAELKQLGQIGSRHVTTGGYDPTTDDGALHYTVAKMLKTGHLGHTMDDITGDDEMDTALHTCIAGMLSQSCEELMALCTNTSLQGAKRHVLEITTNPDKLTAFVEHNLSAPTTSTPTTTTQGDNTMTTTPTATAAGPITLPAESTKLVDAVLGVATEGAVPSVNAMLAENFEAKQKIVELEGLLESASQKVLAASQAPHPSTMQGKVFANADELTYEIVMTRLDDVFPADCVEGGWSETNKRTTGSIEVPVFVWRDANGDKVQHPMTPTVDPTYKFTAKKLRKMARAIVRNTKPWFYGDTGTGKSEFCLMFAAYTGQPVLRINMDGDLGRMEIIGREKLTVDGGTTVSEFIEGILPQALQMPCILLIDEISLVKPDISFVFQRVMDDRGLAISEDGNREVMPHAWFRVVATDNTNGQLDERAMYQGTRPQNEAFRNRFRPFVHFDYLEPSLETEVLKGKVPGIDERVATALCAFAHEARLSFRNGDTMMPVSLRDLSYIGVEATAMAANLGADEALAEAMEDGMFNRASSEDREALERIWSQVKPVLA